jgi:hypothetical protein
MNFEENNRNIFLKIIDKIKKAVDEIGEVDVVGCFYNFILEI